MPIAVEVGIAKRMVAFTNGGSTAAGSFFDLICSLIGEVLRLVQSFAREGRQVPQELLFLMQLCEGDNFQKTPPGARSYAFLLPLALENLESSPEYAEFCRLLLTEERFNEVFPPAERGEAGNLAFPKEYLLSIAWRYLNQTGTPALLPEALGEILAQSEAVREKRSFNFRMVAPLVGLSGSGELPEFRLGRWRLRRLSESEVARVQYFRQYFSLPATMVYSGEAPPCLSFALVLEDCEVPFSGLAAGWNVVRPEFLPEKELKDLVSLLQAATSVGEFGRWYAISCPVLIYYTVDWAANPFGNPFSPDYAWPLGKIHFGREWFLPPAGWEDWVSRMFSFVERAPEPEKVRYRRALRWFAESIFCDNLGDRMMKLFVALEVLCLGGIKADRGKGQKIAARCSELLHQDDRERRRWRNFIRDAYEKVRSLLFHEGADEEKLARVIKEKLKISVPEECADLLEIAFRTAWNELALGPAREKA
ncbi:hypothetical protein Tph_c02860 [Thermacetogenium phaeum DSM 12270]|uniref:Uncharacterized protein n=1 Tax=Thermacetogenium phaeum (strain ATCC BAA-254 / DSM 26808 / PB) TaxID=1089553 RepID=K4LCP7_THEPS|nr:HEPN domain-containing protein [Thermacetogenium phaeum]AFV10533.1 hypothetical protein Tph_c02860 [Thermacetogenium phaeum DSM 12270]